jgi:hypothetical protein
MPVKLQEIEVIGKFLVKIELCEKNLFKINRQSIVRQWSGNSQAIVRHWQAVVWQL